MIAIDTNVLVRTLVEDDPAQTAAARELMASESVWIPLTVVLETEWVLRSRYAYDAEKIVMLLSTVFGRPEVHVQNPDVVLRALAWSAAGMELSDALHLASSQGCSAFISFDRDLARKATVLDTIPVREP